MSALVVRIRLKTQGPVRGNWFPTIACMKQIFTLLSVWAVKLVGQQDGYQFYR
jgi:hypothetical protein